jgi:hypothetical protein
MKAKRVTKTSMAMALWAGVAATAFAGTVRIDPAARPSAPTNLKARALAPSVAELRWESASEKNARWFRIEYQEGGNTFKTLAHCGANTTTLRVTHLKPGVPATFRVTAINDAGESTPSPVASAKLPALIEEPEEVGPIYAGRDVTVALPKRSVMLRGENRGGIDATPGWSQVSGPGTVMFVDPKDMGTEASFPGGGIYELCLDADPEDAGNKNKDWVRVTVYPDYAALKASLRHSPSSRKLVFAIDAPDMKLLENLTLDLTVTDIETGKVILNQKSGAAGLLRAEFAVDTPERNGMYEVTATLINKDGIAVRIFDRDEQGQPLQFGE